MATSILEQYSISDFLEWNDQKRLVLNPTFQRRSVWTDAASSFLIDTILRRLSLPKIYMRTKIDLQTRTSYREVVDGQQRLRAIIKFASDELVLNKRAKEFQGLTYSQLDPELKEDFLTYTLGVEQLINASDDDVLEIFARLNSYTVSLNPPELRHAKYQGDFKWSVHEAATRWNTLWDKFRVVSVRERVRMQDDSLMSEMFGILLDGITGGGQPRIEKLYRKYDPEFPSQDLVVGHVNNTLEFITSQFADVLVAPLSRAPHFLMLYGAVAHALFGIPTGELGDQMPARDPRALSDVNIAIENLSKLSNIIDEFSVSRDNKEFVRFWFASTSSTQTIASRRTRFPFYYRALLPERF